MIPLFFVCFSDRGEKHDMGNTLKEVIKKEAESDDSSKDGKATRVKSTG